MSKEHAYAYEAGYRDGSINYELEHCPACKNVADLQEVLAENANLKAENAALRIVSLTSLRVICNHCVLRYSSACSSCLVEDALNKLKDQTKKEEK